MSTSSSVIVTSVYSATISGSTLTLGTEQDSATSTVYAASGSHLSGGFTDSFFGSSAFTYDGNIYDSSGAVVGFVGTEGGNTYVFITGNAGSSTKFIFDSAANGADVKVTSGSGATYTPTTYTCFMAGTMIATPKGAVAIEQLRAGDFITLADGGEAAIIWLGRQTVSTRFADPLRAYPIRITAGALADGVPARDLLVSPDHALLVDGILVHASALVNGVSILREKDVADSFVYYHIELSSHTLLLAENTPAETFIDNADRMNFDNWDEHPNDAALVEMDLPRAKSSRQLPSTMQARLKARAETLYGRKAAAA